MMSLTEHPRYRDFLYNQSRNTIDKYKMQSLSLSRPGVDCIIYKDRYGEDHRQNFPATISNQ